MSSQGNESSSFSRITVQGNNFAQGKSSKWNASASRGPAHSINSAEGESFEGNASSTGDVFEGNNPQGNAPPRELATKGGHTHIRAYTIAPTGRPKPVIRHRVRVQEPDLAGLDPSLYAP
jgi:hypothetical protein